MEYTLIRWFPLHEYSAAVLPSNYYAVMYKLPEELSQRVCFAHTAIMTDEIAHQAIVTSIEAKTSLVV